MEEPVIAQKGPYEAAAEAAKRYLRGRCGRSADQPLCNGTHATL